MSSFLQTYGNGSERFIASKPLRAQTEKAKMLLKLPM